MSFRKTPIEKFRTQLNYLRQFSDVSIEENQILVDGNIIVEFNENEIIYGTARYSSTSREPIYQDDYSVTIPLTHENLRLINSNPINPPRKTRIIMRVFNNITGTSYNRMILGSNENRIDNTDLYITRDLYLNIIEIDKEEGRDKSIRVRNRAVPFLNSQFGIDTTEIESERNYALLLREIIESGEVTQNDIVSLSEQLEKGEPTKVVIEKQINKQTEWLLETIERILEIDKLTVPKTKQFGNEEFGYSKISITGPEHLMEKILSDYGQYSLFGVPALLNTNKYVIHEGRSRSQFDLILINHIGDVEVVELKRPDKYLLEFGGGRGKFYPSKDLAIAISQTERYITAINKDNDDEYLIDGLKIRDFLNREIGNTMFIESIRPKGLIIMGSWQKLAKDYDKLDEATKRRITRENYENDSRQAYKELKNSLKNITILTYSELLENARTRLELFDNEE